MSILSLPGEVVETQVQRKETAPGLTHPMGGQWEPMGCHSHVVQGPGSGASWIGTSTSRRYDGSSLAWQLSWHVMAIVLVSKQCGYGSIPINTIFSGMNIHLPAILGFTRGTRVLTHPHV